MTVLPFDLPPRSRVLVIGAGGGFDFLCGLPVALELEARGCTAVIANYSFTDLDEVRDARKHGEHLLEITADSRLEAGDYFPELYLAKWFRERKAAEHSVWCLAKAGVVPTLAGYDYIVNRFDIDTVICVDGGVDGLFRGDEHDLGTPSMDSISVIAASLCRAERKIYACAAFGTEGAEGGVSHAQALNRMADLIREDAFLGVSSVRTNDPAGAEFLAAVEFINGRLAPLRRSIVVGSLAAAMRGAYGRTVVHEKTRDRQPWVSPLTTLVWYFDAVAVARMKLFYEGAKDSTTVADVAETIAEVRRRVQVQPFESIPI